MGGTSIGGTRGTATKKNGIGKAKWRSHGFPPAGQMYRSVSAATEAVWIQLSGRHSGVPISKSRIGKRRKSAGTPMKIQGKNVLEGGHGAGRSSQRSQKRWGWLKGTNH